MSVGALVTKAADQTAANYTAGAVIAWDSEVYDDAAFHDNATNNSRLTIPAGVSRVRLCACVRITLAVANEWINLVILKGGTAAYPGAAEMLTEANATTRNVVVYSPVLEVAENDYFEAFLQIEADTSVSVIAQRSWFSLEVVD